MERALLIASLRDKFGVVQGVLHERGLRLWAAAEARQIGRGGEIIVEEAIGISRKTIRCGLREIETPPTDKLAPHQSRIKGGGRKNTPTKYENIKAELDTLIDPVMRGDGRVATTMDLQKSTTTRG